MRPTVTREEALRRLIDKAGLTQEQAERALDCIVGVLKERLPATILNRLENLSDQDLSERRLPLVWPSPPPPRKR